MQSKIKTTLTYFLLAIFLPALLSPKNSAGEEKSWQTDIEAGYSLNSGNTEIENLHTSWTTQYLHGKNELIIHGDAGLSKAEGETNEESYHGSVNYDSMLNQKVSVFVLSNAENNKFQKVDIRLGLGGGSKYTFIKNKKRNISMSAAVLYEMEKHTDTNNDKELARLSLRPKLKVKVFRESEFSSLFFYQPRIDFFKDYRLHSKTALSVPIETYLHIKISFIYQYNNLPEAGVKRGDTAFLTSLVISF